MLAAVSLSEVSGYIRAVLPVFAAIAFANADSRRFDHSCPSLSPMYANDAYLPISENVRTAAFAISSASFLMTTRFCLRRASSGDPFSITTTGQGARQIFNAVLPQIKVDFAGDGISDAQIGLVGSVFTLVFGLAIPLGGMFADFFSRKWMVVFGTLLFAVGIFASGFAAGVVSLVIAYGVVNAAGVRTYSLSTNLTKLPFVLVSLALDRRLTP